MLEEGSLEDSSTEVKAGSLIEEEEGSSMELDSLEDSSAEVKAGSLIEEEEGSSMELDSLEDSRLSLLEELSIALLPLEETEGEAPQEARVRDKMEKTSRRLFIALHYTHAFR